MLVLQRLEEASAGCKGMEDLQKQYEEIKMKFAAADEGEKKLQDELKTTKATLSKQAEELSSAQQVRFIISVLPQCTFVRASLFLLCTEIVTPLSNRSSKINKVKRILCLQSVQLLSLNSRR